MFETLKADREIHINFTTPKNRPIISIFVGLYNAEAYLDLVLENLLRQPKDTYILISDNASTDSTWGQISKWMEIFPNRLTISRNPINLGGWGNLLINLDLMLGTWVATMHQDDVYFGNHVQILSQYAASASDDTICIATDMGSITNGGKTNFLATPQPRWLISATDRASIFLANLRMHSLPNPASAFRTDDFAKYSGPWHSTAMPDTEWLLNALCEKNVQYVQERTMDYRETTNSESRIVMDDQRILGSYLGLMRVISSSSFSKFIEGIAPVERSQFASKLFESLKIRLLDQELASFASLQAAEVLAKAWDYSEQYSNEVIAANYSAIGADRVFNQVSAIAKYHGVDIQANLDEYINLATLRNDERIRSTTTTFPKLGLVAFNFLPHKLKKKLFSTFVEHFMREKPQHPWNFDWKNEN